MQFYAAKTLTLLAVLYNLYRQVIQLSVSNR